jgi:hypothetical protein
MGYDDERKLERLQVQDDTASHELSIAQKRAMIREAKRRHGVNWRDVMSKIGGSGKSDWFRFSNELKESVVPRNR